MNIVNGFRATNRYDSHEFCFLSFLLDASMQIQIINQIKSQLSQLMQVWFRFFKHEIIIIQNVNVKHGFSGSRNPGGKRYVWTPVMSRRNCRYHEQSMIEYPFLVDKLSNHRPILNARFIDFHLYNA